jgi:hypothetical protein
MTLLPPPSRTITAETATEFEIDRTGWRVPVNDGKDVPGWEYVNVRVIGSYDVQRIPTLYVGEREEAKPPCDELGRPWW